MSPEIKIGGDIMKRKTVRGRIRTSSNMHGWYMSDNHRRTSNIRIYGCFKGQCKRRARRGFTKPARLVCGGKRRKPIDDE